MLLVLLACTPDPAPPRDDPAPIDTGSPPPSTPVVPADVLSATCVPDPGNAVRATCTVTMSVPAPVALEVGDGVESALFTSAAVEVDHVVPLWGLTAEATWAFTARATGGGATVEGTLTTGPLPAELRIDPGLVTSGVSSIVHLAMPLSCAGGWLTVLDAQGRVRGYHDFSPSPLPGSIDAFEYTEDHTLLALVAGSEIREVDLTGRALLAAGGFDRPLHHDVTRRAGKIWTLMADSYPGPDGQTYVEDVVVTLDATGAIVDRWEEHDHLDATLSTGAPGGFWQAVFPDAIDAWHTNGLFVEDDGDFLISLKKENTLLFVSGGEVLWAFAGDGVGDAFPSDVSLLEGGDPTFSDQHQPRLLPDGHLTVFDNGSGPGSVPRGLELDLDPTALTAAFVADWPLDLVCPIQSSVFPLDGGHHVVACASQKVVVEFDAGGTEVARFAPTCDAGGLPLMVRAQPLDLWTGSAAGVTATRIQTQPRL